MVSNVILDTCDFLLSRSNHIDSKSLLHIISAESMSEITTNFRLGFGSFVDKKTMPYVSMIPEK